MEINRENICRLIISLPGQSLLDHTSLPIFHYFVIFFHILLSFFGLPIYIFAMLLDYIFRHERAIFLANKLGVAGGLFVVKRIQYLLWNLLINRTNYVKCQLVTSIFWGSTQRKERRQTAQTLQTFSDPQNWRDTTPSGQCLPLW